ncbi:MAG: lytic transglycosylase domain-containing protein [Veillonella sp.]|nr:lytic transglycosylase domain-containing protein [Veillonella sp.]
MDWTQFGEVSPNVQEAIMQASNSTGLDPNLLARVAKQESGFNPSAQSEAGATGLFQTMPETAAELGINDMTNPYESAMGGAKYLAQNLQKYGGNLTKALAAYNAGPGNVDSWISNGWDGSPDSIPIEETRNYVKNIGGGANNTISANYKLANGKSPIDIRAMFSLDDPNEKIDFGKVMSILQAPQQNVASASDEALRSALARQASHRARGRWEAPFYAESDKQLMQSGIAQAQEEAKLNNKTTQLTGAGQLAQMIANSKNSSNAGMLASLGAMMGVRLDPMANRYMSQNDMAKMATQFARQDQLNAEQRAFQAQQAQLQRDFTREMTNNKLAQQLAVAEARARGRSGGSGGSGSLMTSDKNADKIASDFNGFLQDLSEKDKFSQADVDALNRGMSDAVLKLSSAQATPYAQQLLERMQNDYDYAIKHMQKSESGNKLDYKLGSDIIKKLEAKKEE